MSQVAIGAMLDHQNYKSIQINSKRYLDEGFLNRLFFSWVGSLIQLNKTAPFQQENHHSLRPCDQSRAHFDALKANWLDAKNTPNHFPLLRTIIFSYPKKILLLTFLGVLKILIFFSTPYMVNLTMRFVEEPNPSLFQMIALIVFLPLARISSTVIGCNSAFVNNLLGPQLKCGLVALIYSKILKISLIRNKDHSAGSIINHYEVDCNKLEWLTNTIQDLIVIPIQILIGIGVVFLMIGYAFLAGVVVIIVVALFSYIITKRLGKLQEEFMKKKDERMKLLTQILNAIKYIKMNGWEKVFGERLKAARSGELEQLQNSFYLDTLSSVNFLLGPEGVFMATLGMYLLFGNEFDIKKVMTMASTFWLLSGPFQRIAGVVSTAIECKVAMKRVETFLLSEEIDNSYIIMQNDQSDPIALSISNGNFSWRANDNEPQETQTNKKTGYNLIENSFQNIEITTTSSASMSSNQEEQEKVGFSLQEIELKVKKGDFIAIIGDVGSGKSSLLYSLVGEMYFDPVNIPRVLINQDMAFLTQSPWIISTTLKENITFGKLFDPNLYKQCVHYAAMEVDIHLLPHQDESEIGEKGINLSGGQKARLSLARALYREADIYLLDDILSAVDIHVGTFIIEECLKKYLAGKTRIMVTHNLDYLKYADYIYMMEDGKITNKGTLETAHSVEDSGLIDEKFDKADCDEQISVSRAASKESKNATKIDSIEDTKLQALDNDDDTIGQLTVAEDRETGKIQASTLKFFWESWGGYKFFPGWFSLTLFKETIFLYLVIFLAHWGDSDPTPSDSFRNLMLYYAIDFMAFYGHYFELRWAFNKSLKFGGLLHQKMVKSVLEAPLNLFFDRVPSGRILNRFSNDIDKIDSALSWCLINISTSFFATFSCLIMCITYSNIVIILPALVFIVLCWKLYTQYTGLNRELQRLKSIATSPVASTFTETLQGVVIVRNFRQEKCFFDLLLIKQDECLKNNLLMGAANHWYTTRCALASLTLIIPICVIISLFKDSINIKVGNAGFLAGQMISLCEFMSWFLWEVSSMDSALVSLERCHYFTKIGSEKITPSQPVKISSQWPLKGEVRFRNYSTRYRSNLPCVINNLNLKVKSGEKIGIVGRTGSGKSTLMLSLLRLLEAKEGSIEIDGVNIENVSLPELRDKITVIPQDPHIFEGTLRENIDILAQYDDNMLTKVLEMVNLSTLLRAKEGLSFSIKSGGENLSAGEKQMICIARALLKKSKIILIDEAISSIDMNSEEVFLRTITERFADCTVLMIAHRLKTVINCDKIIVMKEGRVAESGAPDELIKLEGGIFSDMWKETIKTNKPYNLEEQIKF